MRCVAMHIAAIFVKERRARRIPQILERRAAYANQSVDWDSQRRISVACGAGSRGSRARYKSPALAWRPRSAPVHLRRHSDRLPSAAAFASPCGVSPVLASSGKTTRHRQNRGGDRQANRALYIIAVSRMAHDARTRTYVARRTTEGLSQIEITRCLKRYIARGFWAILTYPRTQTTPAKDVQKPFRHCKSFRQAWLADTRWLAGYRHPRHVEIPGRIPLPLLWDPHHQPGRMVRDSPVMRVGGDRNQRRQT